MLDSEIRFQFIKQEKMVKIKIKKYFLNNLRQGDFVRFPSGQRYKILSCGRAFPVCSIPGCRKQAQARMFELFLWKQMFVQPPLGKNKLYLFCIACFSKLSPVEVKKAAEEKEAIRKERQKRAEENKTKRLERKTASICKTQKIN